MDNISIIIRNRNEAEHIGFALQSVIDHYNEPEIIIIDNESTDDSLKVVSLFDNCDIEIYDLKDKYTPGKALNLGVKKATRDTILVLSAHCQITKLDFGKVKTQLDSDIAAVWGKQIPIWNGKKINRRYMWSNFKDKSDTNYFCKYEDRYFLHNAFSFYKKETLIKYPFDEYWPSKEDRYWANDIIDNKKLDIVYNSNIECNHFYTESGATWKGVG